MKILHIIDSGGVYGAEVMLLTLIAEQLELGLEPVIASIGKKSISNKPIETEAFKRGFKVKQFRMAPGPNLTGALKVLRFAHRENFNLMHSHGYKGDILFGLIPKSVRKLPLITTLHGWTNINGLTKMKIYEWLDALSLNFIDVVVLVNKGIQSHPKLKNRKGLKLKIVNNGIPALSKPPTKITEDLDPIIINFCKGGYTIGSIGRLSSEKGYKYLIGVLALLIKKGLDVRLIIIGEGGQRNYLEGLITKYKLSDYILMPGYRENAKQYIPFFKIFVIPSRTEGLPITLLEAMQTKVPIVASKVGGIPDVLQNGIAGLLIQPCKVDALAEAIIHIHNDIKFADKLANRAYQRVIKNYSSKTMALEYLNVYNGLSR